MSIGLALKKVALVPASDTRTSNKVEAVNEGESEDKDALFNEYNEGQYDNSGGDSGFGDSRDSGFGGSRDSGFGGNGACNALLTPTPRRGRYSNTFDLRSFNAKELISSLIDEGNKYSFNDNNVNSSNKTTTVGYSQSQQVSLVFLLLDGPMDAIDAMDAMDAMDAIDAIDAMDAIDGGDRRR